MKEDIKNKIKKFTDAEFNDNEIELLLKENSFLNYLLSGKPLPSVFQERKKKSKSKGKPIVSYKQRRAIGI